LPRLSKGKPLNDSSSYCHCEPERFSVQAWQSRLKIFVFSCNGKKDEIATPAYGGLAMTKIPTDFPSITKLNDLS
jgi:hypothetical protein